MKSVRITELSLINMFIGRLCELVLSETKTGVVCGCWYTLYNIFILWGMLEQWRAERRQLAACSNVLVSLYILQHYQAGWRDGGASLVSGTDNRSRWNISDLTVIRTNLDHLDFPVCPVSRDSGVLTLIIWLPFQCESGQLEANKEGN